MHLAGRHLRRRVEAEGNHIRGTIDQAYELQPLVNQEARVTTGIFRRTTL